MRNHKKLRVHLAALTRMTFDCVVSVPADFVDDNESWDKGDCYTEERDVDDDADFVLLDGELVPAVCPNSPDGKHEAVWEVAVLHTGGGEDSLSVPCVYCGKSASVSGLRKLDGLLNWGDDEEADDSDDD